MTLIFDNLVCSSRGWAHRGARPFVSHGDGELGVEEQGGLAAKGER